MAAENKHNEAVRGITNDDLLAKWRTFSLDESDDNMGAFLTELIDHSTLLMVVLADREIKTDENGRAQVDQDVEMQFPLMTSQNQKNIQPVFTDWQEVNTLYDNWTKTNLQENIDRSSVLPITYSDLAQLIGQHEDIDGIAINPFTDNIFLARETVADLAKQQQEHHAANNEVKVTVAEPENLPAGFETTLAAAIKEAAVAQAWLRVLSYDGTEHLVLILDANDLPEDELSALTKRLGTMGDDLLKGENLQLSVVPLDSDSQPMVDGIAPFYHA